MVTKVCTDCKRDLPATVYYFYKALKGKHGLASKCKECKGQSFGIRRINRVLSSREGYQFCVKCREELPKKSQYFFKRGSINYQTVCKKCQGIDYGIHRPNRSLAPKEGHLYCSKCMRELPKDSFSFSNDKPSGKVSWCRDCINEKYKVKMFNPEERARMQAYRKEYSQSQKGKTARSVSNQKRRAYKENTFCCYSTKIWEDAVLYFKNTCAYCGDNGKLTKDHFIPISKNGEYTARNIVPCCARCNSSKQDKDFFDWYPLQGFYSKQREKRALKYLNYIEKGKQQLTIVTA